MAFDFDPMDSLQSEIWENSLYGDGPCEGCPKAGSEFNHPGFFNFDADILVVEESPSYSHFDFSSYERWDEYESYQQFYEDDYLDSVLSWNPIQVFLEPVFARFGMDDRELIDEVFMTSCVKCPVSNRGFSEPFEHCSSYLHREIEEINPAVIITAGGLATKETAKILGVTPARANSVSISKQDWWGLSRFETDPMMIHVPHWGYYATHNQLSDDEWGTAIEAVQKGLATTVYS